MNSKSLSNAGPQRPEFIRLPKPGMACPYTGLTRSFLYALVSAGKIKSVSLRERGKARGCRLINYDSLIEFLAKAGDETGGVAA